MSRAKWVAPALWGTFIEVLTSWPRVPDFGEPEGSDKVVHFGLYAVFAYLVIRAAQAGRPSLRLVTLTLLGLMAWAAADEWHQRFIDGRTPSTADWAADSAGVAVGIAVAWARFRPVTPGHA